MFEHMIAEVIKMNQKKDFPAGEWSMTSLRPVQIRPSLLNRVLPTLGDVMIRIGLMLKDRPQASLTTDQAHAPNFLIML